MLHIRMAAIAAAAVGLTASGCSRAPAQPAAPPPPPVTVSLPLQQQVVDWDDFVGRFEAPQRVDVRARAGGYLQSVHFKDGQQVRAGQLLFTLDARPAQAQLAAARAELAQATTQLGLARQELARAETLLAARAISLEEAETRRAEVARGQAAIQAAQATVRARALDVEFTRVTAPSSGVISERRVDVGNLVAGGTSAGDVLTTIVSNDPIHFAFDASEALLLKYQRQAQRGRPPAIRIRLQDEADFRWGGVVDFSDNAVDQASGATRMRALVANPNRFLKPGMFGHARMEGSTPYQAMLIPDAAVVADGVRKLAYVVAPDGTVQARPVEPGPLVGSLRVIRRGIAATDRVIVNGIQRARPGQKVQPTLGRIENEAAPATQPTLSAAPASSATVASSPAR